MKTLLLNEIKKERPNSSALGALNEVVSELGIDRKTLSSTGFMPKNATQLKKMDNKQLKAHFKSAEKLENKFKRGSEKRIKAGAYTSYIIDKAGKRL